MSKQISARQYLKDAFIFFFSPRQYIGRVFIIEGKKRKIIAETTYNVLFEGMKKSVPKEYLKTISQPETINP